MRLRRRWIFDLDGTLTVPVHDYDAARTLLGLPAGAPILEALRALPPDALALATARLDDWEAHHAEIATAAPGAATLLAGLRQDGVSLGILTRNRREVAWRTLQVIGLDGYFDPLHVLGRHEAPAKPAPDGIHRLLRAWSGRADEAVMVGDSRHDTGAARQAGVLSILVRRDPSEALRAEADLVADTLLDVHRWRTA